jgi:hypothetical protein
MNSAHILHPTGYTNWGVSLPENKEQRTERILQGARLGVRRKMQQSIYHQRIRREGQLQAMMPRPVVRPGADFEDVPTLAQLNGKARPQENGDTTVFEDQKTIAAPEQRVITLSEEQQERFRVTLTLGLKDMLRAATREHQPDLPTPETLVDPAAFLQYLDAYFRREGTWDRVGQLITAADWDRHDEKIDSRFREQRRGFYPSSIINGAAGELIVEVLMRQLEERLAVRHPDAFRLITDECGKTLTHRNAPVPAEYELRASSRYNRTMHASYAAPGRSTLTEFDLLAEAKHDGKTVLYAFDPTTAFSLAYKKTFADVQLRRAIDPKADIRTEVVHLMLGLQDHPLHEPDPNLGILPLPLRPLIHTIQQRTLRAGSRNGKAPRYC